LLIYLAYFFLELILFDSDKICRDNQNKHFVFSNFVLKVEPFMRYVEKHVRAGQATDDVTARVHCMPDT